MCRDYYPADAQAASEFEKETIELSKEDMADFLKALDRPVEANKNLKEAYKLHEEIQKWRDSDEK